MYKLDLHTHSTDSKDGGISDDQYAMALKDMLNYIAVTDHNSVSKAMELKKRFGNKIIVGEEINTAEGEIIGLFLKTLIKPGLSSLVAAKQIKDQGGLVYIPHPLENIRNGLSLEALDNLNAYIDIVEVHNGRAFFNNRGPDAVVWARLNRKACSAASDAHGYKGLDSSYALISKAPTAENLISELNKARLITKRPPLKTLLYPKTNRLLKKLGRK